MPVACLGLEVSFGVNHNQREWKTILLAFNSYRQGGVGPGSAARCRCVTFGGCGAPAPVVQFPHQTWWWAPSPLSQSWGRYCAKALGAGSRVAGGRGSTRDQGADGPPLTPRQYILHRPGDEQCRPFPPEHPKPGRTRGTTNRRTSLAPIRSMGGGGGGWSIQKGGGGSIQSSG